MNELTDWLLASGRLLLALLALAVAPYVVGSVCAAWYIAAMKPRTFGVLVTGLIVGFLGWAATNAAQTFVGGL